MRGKSSMAWVFVFLSIFLTILTSCASTFPSKQIATVEGYVIVGNDNVYFITNKKFETKAEFQEYIEERLHEKFPTDTVLNFVDSNTYQQLKSGYKIKVWSSQILESYPAQMIVEKFEVVDKKVAFSLPFIYFTNCNSFGNFVKISVPSFVM